MFLTPEEYRRKQNQQALQKLKIPQPGAARPGRVVPFQ